ncbi:MAG: RadC family protein [Anaerolineales bacterium]
MSETDQTPVYRIMDIQESDRPRERLARLGAESLSSAELLAILLRVGRKGENAVQMGHRLLQDFGGLAGLHRASFDEVCARKGVGPAKAAQLKAAVELGKRINSQVPEERPAIQSPQDAASLVLYEMGALEQEELRVILLDTRHHVLRVEPIYRGSVNSSQIRVGELFKAAVRVNATALIVVHNHPSGDPTPSPDDVAVTKAIVQAGKMLDVEVLDHLVIGYGKFVSLKERGLGF